MGIPYFDDFDDFDDFDISPILARIIIISYTSIVSCIIIVTISNKLYL